MRHPAFHVSAELVGSVSSVTGFLRQCAPDFFYFFLKFTLDVLGKKSIIALPSCKVKNNERNTSNMIKTIAIILGLTAVTATANTLPPTWEGPVTELR